MDGASNNRHNPAILGRLTGVILAGDNAVKTDMGGANADREVSQGAAGVVWLALDTPQELTGKFLRDGKVIPW
jgi:hypothetical protein